jgi:lipoate synthase
VTDSDIHVLKANDGEEVEILCKDGEVMQARVLFVSESERDVIYNLISTNRPERYPVRPSEVSYTTSFKDIETVKASRG